MKQLDERATEENTAFGRSSGRRVIQITKGSINSLLTAVVVISVPLIFEGLMREKERAGQGCVVASGNQVEPAPIFLPNRPLNPISVIQHI